MAKRRTSRSAGLLVIVLALGLIWPIARAPLATACSCAAPTGAQVLSTTQAAFVGIATEVFDTEDHLGEPASAVAFDVIEPLKGDLGETAVVLVKSSEDTCGSPRFLPDWPYTRFGQPSSVSVSAGMRVSEACVDLSPDFLAEGATELPQLAPPVAGTKAEVISYGEWMGTGARLLGRDGTLAAYVDSKPGSFGFSAAVCGDTNVVAHTSRLAGDETLMWRDVATTSVVAERALSGTVNDPAVVWSCTSNQRVIVSANSTLGGFRVVGPDGFDVEPIPAARKLTISADGRVAAAETNQLDFSIVEIDSGEQLASFAPELLGPGPNWDLALSPDGTKLAVATNNARTIAVVTSTGELIASVPAPLGIGRMWWIDDSTIAGTSDGAVVLVDLNAAEPSLVASVPGQLVSSVGARVLTRHSGSSLHVITDLTTSERYQLEVPAGTRDPLHLLAQPVVVQDNGFAPSTSIPLTGIRVPRTIDELRGVATTQTLPGPQASDSTAQLVLSFAGFAVAGLLGLALYKNQRRPDLSTRSSEQDVGLPL